MSLENNILYNVTTKIGNEIQFVKEVISNGAISGNKKYSKLCQTFFQKKYNFQHAFLTSSCSMALEIVAQLCELNKDDEVILPSYAYVTDASAFVKTKATLVFADSEAGQPHIDPSDIKKKLTSKTKALVIIHYAGIPCKMDEILPIVKEHNLILIEDCAQAIGVQYNNKYLGSFGDYATFSFHETKNIHCGEGGLLVVNNSNKIVKARQVWEEGTDKFEYESGKKSNYEWVALGSSYQPSELSAAFLYAQLTQVDIINGKRKEIWMNYYRRLSVLNHSRNVIVPTVSSGNFNGHIFYLGLTSKSKRDELIMYLKNKKIQASSHYLPLHQSPFWLKNNDSEFLPNATFWSDCLIRLPIYNSLSEENQDFIINHVLSFFEV